MKDHKILHFVSQILEVMPKDWLQLTTHRLDIYNEEKAKVEFLDELDRYFASGHLDTESLNNMPTSYDYIRLGHPLSCLLEWSIAKMNKMEAERVIAFSSQTMPILAVLRKNTINFDSVVNLGNNPFLASLEAMIEFTKYSSKKNYHSFGVNYQVQSSFHKRDEANYYQLIGLWKEIHSGWQNGFQKLYEYQSAWSFLYTYGHKKYKLSIYAKQDLYLNNSPDIQTGFSLNIPIFNN